MGHDATSDVRNSSTFSRRKPKKRRMRQHFKGCSRRMHKLKWCSTRPWQNPFLPRQLLQLHIQEASAWRKATWQPVKWEAWEGPLVTKAAAVAAAHQSTKQEMGQRCARCLSGRWRREGSPGGIGSTIVGVAAMTTTMRRQRRQQQWQQALGAMWEWTQQCRSANGRQQSDYHRGLHTCWLQYGNTGSKVAGTNKLPCFKETVKF